MTPALSIRNLVSGYAGSSVLRGVDLDVPFKGSVAVLGRNGVGKSTLVNTVMGLVQPYSGSVCLGNKELAGRRPDVIAKSGVALVPQGRRVFSALTVAEHLEMAARIGKGRGPWNQTRVLKLLPGLGERLAHRGGQLSGGEQQMLAIARALLTHPKLLLLDEPSEGLAPRVVQQVGEVIGELAELGIAVLLVEQNLRLAFSVSSQVAVMEKGNVVLVTSTEDFRSDPARARRLLGVE